MISVGERKRRKKKGIAPGTGKIHCPTRPDVFNENRILFPLHGVDCTLTAPALTEELLPRVPVSTLFRRVIRVPRAF